ncbi:MAG: glycosyltransferase [Anaerolineae bacterium]|nr:glycosyltransferase [Anaerolineae bacterium]
MRILIAGQTFYKRNNGQAVFTINLAEGLAQVGHEVLVVAPSERGRPYAKKHNGLTIQTVPTLPFNDNVNVSGFSDGIVERTVVDFKPDLIHIQDHYFICRSVLKTARKYDIPRMGTNHFLPENLTDNFRIPAWASQPIHRLLWQNMLAVFNTLHAATTPTETAVRILRQQQINVPVQAISCGVDQARFKPRPNLNRAEIRRRYGLHPAKTLFIFVGRVDREKGLDVLMEAIKRLNRHNIQLAVAGRSSYLNTLQTLRRNLSLQQDVVFTGFIPGDDLPLLLNSADIFAMPSGAELQSIATLEAMSSGLPVLAANARALPELVEHKVNGYLFQLGSISDAAHGLAMLADAKAQWPQMRAASLARAQAHSLPITVQCYAGLYQNLLTYPYAIKVSPSTPLAKGLNKIAFP